MIPRPPGAYYRIAPHAGAPGDGEARGWSPVRNEFPQPNANPEQGATLHMTVVLIVLIAIAVYLVGVYNSLVRVRNEIDNSWRQIDVQLKRRHDLIPNLVEAVKGYMQFERDTLTQVVEARAKAISAPDQASRMAAENQITG